MLSVQLLVAVLLTRRMNGHLGYMTTALWNVISLHEAGRRVWLHDDQGGVGDGDDYATHQFDNFNCFRPQLFIYFGFFTGMKMSFASVT